jgi:hypothetical protein
MSADAGIDAAVILSNNKINGKNCAHFGFFISSMILAKTPKTQGFKSLPIILALSPKYYKKIWGESADAGI